MLELLGIQASYSELDEFNIGVDTQVPINLVTHFISSSQL